MDVSVRRIGTAFLKKNPGDRAETLAFCSKRGWIEVYAGLRVGEFFDGVADTGEGGTGGVADVPGTQVIVHQPLFIGPL